MNNEKKTSAAEADGTADSVMMDMTEAAERLEQEAKRSDADHSSYTHVFQPSFIYEGRTYDTLTFNWDALTGKDSLAIEAEMMLKGKTLILPAYTGEYLVGMAARACTYRDDSGNRTVNTNTICALPLKDFQAICNRARNFLLRAGL
ncbi:hypothetical protein [Anaerotruncus colihominis]|uniref:Uncharacterized protein n=1 Tax=Anaerotruncus colihominis TaxID=169435 RepID=A0A845T0Q9_9FIRM|nr:hypothetical protein [Anaerotruncus colihominis]MCR2026887.1 hypothetical protein [Anaerotruncus colihominis]NDO40360.1 hypothetical protein [Anaerotruncus colihominis]